MLGVLRQMAEHYHPSSHREYAGNVAGDKACACNLRHRIGETLSKYNAKKTTRNGAEQDDVVSLLWLHPDGSGKEEAERWLDDILSN